MASQHRFLTAGSEHEGGHGGSISPWAKAQLSARRFGILCSRSAGEEASEQATEPLRARDCWRGPLPACGITWMGREAWRKVADEEEKTTLLIDLETIRQDPQEDT